MTRRVVLAAGGVLWRGHPEAPEVALIHRPQYDDWSLPKGKAKAGEHLLMTALREIAEETGGRGVLGPRLLTTTYPVTVRGRAADKTVTYWSVRWTHGDFEASREVDELEWLPLPAARARVTKRSDGSVLDLFGRTATDTRPLVLLRHGATTSQSSKRRPKRQLLSRTGRDQATALVPLLQSLGAGRLLSAEQEVCTDTLRPYGRSAGVPVRVDPRLDRSAFSGQEQSVADDLRRDVSGATVVVCSSRQVIGGLVGALGRDATLRPPRDTSVRKGGWWLLHLRDGSVSAYERHEPAA